RSAAVRPERETIGDRGKRCDLFDTAVAVGAHDEDRADRIFGRLGHAEHEVVVELALLPVREKLVRSVRANELVEKRAEHQASGELIDTGLHVAGGSSTHPPTRISA